MLDNGVGSGFVGNDKCTDRRNTNIELIMSSCVQWWKEARGRW